MKKILGLVFVLVVSAASFGQVYSQPTFSAAFPAGEVKFSTQDIKSKEGATVSYNAWAVETDNGNRAYIVSYVDYPTARNAAQMSDVITKEFEGISSNPTYKQTDSTVGRLSGLAGTGYGPSSADGKTLMYAYTRAALTENRFRLWQVIVVSSTPLTSTQVNTFFDSVVIK